MFERPIPLLRDAVVSFKDLYNELVVLIDNLDEASHLGAPKSMTWLWSSI